MKASKTENRFETGVQKIKIRFAKKLALTSLIVILCYA